MKFNIPKYFNRSHFRVSGIYFFIYKGKIVYIGKSVDLINRLFNSDVYRLKNVDSIRVIACAPDKLTYYERRWIIQFRPKHNRANLYIWKGSTKNGVSPRKRIPINCKKASHFKEA